MDYVFIATAALVVSLLTFFSGFGLGTLLLPVFILFFPVEWAVAATATVHFANNLFKAGLIGKHADRSVLWRFIGPAAVFSVLGALFLIRLADVAPLYCYTVGQRTFDITSINLVIALLMFVFALFDLIPGMDRMAFPRKWIPLGGALSGFVGGLSGHQGALRTAVLIRLGLSKEAFIGTAVLCAVTVDIFRLAVYGVAFLRQPTEAIENGWSYIGMGIIAAFIGSFMGQRLLKKVSLPLLHKFIGWMILSLSIALAAGWI
jgi:uncharacterized membrane protein YfcA